MDEEEEREMREQQVALEQVSDRSEPQCLRSGLKAYVVSAVPACLALTRPLCRTGMSP